jgi:hypothetical protein
MTNLLTFFTTLKSFIAQAPENLCFSVRSDEDKLFQGTTLQLLPVLCLLIKHHLGDRHLFYIAVTLPFGLQPTFKRNVCRAHVF